ncbi:MAG: FAD-dependent oxidoreductase [Pseudomonadota bacterium]
MLDALPPHLSDRTRTLKATPAASGEFVLYWAHHALRADQNPALDVARHLGETLKKPVLVVQGLGGRHPYSSDRHHLFALQCARDLADDLAGLGIAYRFHLDPPQHGRVGDFAARAAVVVLEEMPVPPMRDWQAALIERTSVPFVAVDARCIVPMARITKRHERAFAFRKAAAEDYRARLLSTYPECAATAPAPDPALVEGAYPVRGRTDRAFMDDIACLDIDHSVAPVWETPGGARAANARWAAFRESGLSSYHRLRNDAAVEPPRGVSRLSPYLHYGCVSPFRVAREAALEGGKGGEKFLDELFVWRELAHNFCFHTKNLNTLSAVPSWARETLREHASDPRPAVYSWDTLAHARTGNALWDRAQRSLLIHGELHNNVRMTWAKQLLQWTDSPESALRLLLDLNHRYALDGSDPNSYGGLLWALGQFDRPFKPPVPVIGTVRPRSIEAHADRLDQVAWGKRVDVANGAALSVAVVGAGAAGAAAARTLADHGHAVTVFEKSRGAGGRMATRRVDDGTFDHGAQYFSARDAGFLRRVEAWEQDGAAARWPARLVHIRSDGRADAAGDSKRFAFAPGMNTLAQSQLHRIEVTTGCRVERLVQKADKWLLSAKDESMGPFDAVVLTPPAPQLGELLTDSALPVPPAIADATFAPCLAAMVTLPLDADGAGFDAAFVEDDELAWLACDSAKPGRKTASGLSHWVLHATESFSARHIDADKQTVAAELVSALARRFPDWPTPTEAHGHRWRYARVANAVATPARSVSSVSGVWLAGDALGGDSSVETAWLSGVAAAARVMAEANV